ncbi:thioredoxin-like protein [Baffinella frigidus]|nr:thioredoxin-like protein [Cryptophyta sp. CCMP2293]
MDRDETLATFQSVTGWHDMARCIECLETHGWQLDAAVHAAFSHGEHAPAAAQGARMGGGGGRAPAVNHVNHEVPDAGANDGSPGWFHRTTGVPFVRLATLGMHRPEARRPGSESQRFLDTFELEHGPVHPTPQVGTFREAVDFAKREFKFLVVYIHSPYHQDTPEFVTDVVCTEVMKDFVDDTFVFWMGSVLNPEAYNVSALLRASGYPFVAVITTTIDNHTTVCDAHEGLVGREELMNWLLNIVETQGPQLVVQRAEAEGRVMDRRIREEQDQAFEDSLLQDQIREREMREKEERDRIAAADAAVIAQEEARRVAEEEGQRVAEEDRRMAQVAACARMFDVPEPQGPDTVLIAFRLPQGERKQRRFNGADPVQRLYDYVKAFGDLEFEHFEVCTNLPKVVYADRGVSLDEAGLAPQAMLFVQEAL